MQTQVQRFNPRSFIGIGAVAAGLGIVAHFAPSMWASEPLAVAPQVVAQPVAAAQPTAPTQSYDAQTVAWMAAPEQILERDGLQCAYVDEVGLAFCERMIAKVIERRDGGHYEQR